jgi:hypothetical protein
VSGRERAWARQPQPCPSATTGKDGSLEADEVVGGASDGSGGSALGTQ